MHAGIVTIFNAAPGLAGLKNDFYQFTDILCVNETEVYTCMLLILLFLQAELLSGITVTDKVSGESAVIALQKKGPGCVVLTMGSEGVLYTIPNEDNTVHHVPAKPVHVIDTTVS